MDRRVTAIIIALIGMMSVAFASDDHVLFSQANGTYKNGDIEQALLSYQTINQKGPGVWFNMGNCYFALQEYQQAYICWRRAALKAPSCLAADLEERLEMVRTFLHKEDDRSYFFHMIERWAHLMPVILLQLLFLCVWYFFWIMLIQCRFSQWLFIITIIGILCTGMLLLMHYATHLHKKGIVQKETVLRTGPHDQYHEIGTVSLLDDLEIKEVRAGWYKVEFGGQTGWIEADTVETI